MNRQLKFRVWAINEKYYLDAMHPSFGYAMAAYLTGAMNMQKQREEFDEKILLEQFTGLIDQNGKDVYEGDILQSHNVSWLPRAVVVYVGYESRFAPCEIEYYVKGLRDGDLFNQPGEPWMLCACEVVGNIHDNADLVAPKPSPLSLRPDTRPLSEPGYTEDCRCSGVGATKPTS